MCEVQETAGNIFLICACSGSRIRGAEESFKRPVRYLTNSRELLRFVKASVAEQMSWDMSTKKALFEKALVGEDFSWEEPILDESRDARHGSRTAYP